MFKKSLLAAALLVAGGTAANAAEIGVRHSFGTSDRQITNGRFEAVTVGAEAYIEQSGGFSLGGRETYFLDENSTVVQADSPSLRTEWRNEDKVKDFTTHPATVIKNDREGMRVERPTTIDTDVREESSWALGGSAYTRTLIGAEASYVGESYDFTGSSTQSFSELSTFSR